MVVQINVSRGGLPKRPIGNGMLLSTGFVGDSWAHPRFHGGPDQAVLLIASEVITRLKADGFPVYPGALGENITSEGLQPEVWRAGQRYRVGEAEIELTTVREPCNALNVYGPAIRDAIYDPAVRKGDTDSPLWAQSGFYARVLREGAVFAGNPIRLISELA